MVRCARIPLIALMLTASLIGSLSKGDLNQVCLVDLRDM